MDAVTLKSKILNRLNDSLEVVEFDEGYLVFSPLRFSDDDAVTLYVRAHDGGWLVTDQASTILRHHTYGTNVESLRFNEAWQVITRSHSGFIPGGATDGVIETWGDENHLPEMIMWAAQAAGRAEELRWLGGASHRRSFATRVMKRTQVVFASLHAREGVDLRDRARLSSTSGRERQITAAVVEGNDVRLAIQAVGGGSREAREQSYEHCYTVFSNSALDRSQRLAVAVGTHDLWDTGVLSELQSVTDVTFYDEPGALERAFRERVPRHLVTT